MKLGVCVPNDKILIDRPHEADYLEIGVTALRGLEQEDFDTLKRKMKDEQIQAYSANRLFPSDIRLTGEVDWDFLRDYCDKAFYRLAELDVNMVVFGSGKAKSVPDGFSREKAWNQLCTLGELLSDFAKPYEQTVVVEPLAFDEVNIINMTSEGAEYCRSVNRDNFKLLVDFYHFDHNNDDWAVLDDVKGLLHHIHIASPKLRTFLESDADWAFFDKCIKALKRIGYDGGISFEGKPYDTGRLDTMFLQMKKRLQSL